MQRLKAYLKKWWVWLGIISLPVAFGASLVMVKNPPIMRVDGVDIPLLYTDDNEGEDLIIYVDRVEQFSLGAVTSYIGIENKSGVDQNVVIVTSLNKEKFSLGFVQQLIGEEEVFVATATSREVVDRNANPIEPEVFPAHWETRSTWNTLSKGAFNRASLKEKGAPEMIKDEQSSSVLVHAGKIEYFKLKILTPGHDTDEFYIRAYGDKGGYGHLDPWAFEDKFNSDTKSTGDLNAQDSWAGGTQYDVSASQKYEGDQAVTRVNAGDGSVIDVSFSAITDGTVYFAMRTSSAVADDISFVTLRDSGTAIMRARLNNNLATLAVQFDAGYTTVKSSTAVNTWYVVEISEINCTADTYSMRVHDGTSWTSIQSGSMFNAGCADVDNIRFEYGCATCDSSKDFWWDTITPTDPTPAPAASGNPPNDNGDFLLVL